MKSQFLEMITGCARVVLASALAAVILGPAFWCINWLRTCGLPADNFSITQTSLTGACAGDLLSRSIEWYNTTFVGFSRFGSGIGIICGAFWAMGPAKAYRPVPRIITGLVAGSLIFARLANMLTSDTPFVGWAGLLGALWTAAYLYVAGRPCRFKALPEMKRLPGDT
jgi:hypothetical protein